MVLGMATLAPAQMLQPVTPAQANAIARGQCSSPSRSSSFSRPRCSSSRPSRTASGVPIRHVNVPVPRGGFGYGYGGYGYGYGYGGGAYGVASPTPMYRPSRRATRRRTRTLAAPDPRSARNYQLRKALAKYARENSVGGRLYVASDSEKWLIQYDGTPRFSEGMATIPCIGKRAGGHDQRLTLTLHFDDDEAIQADVVPRFQ